MQRRDILKALAAVGLSVARPGESAAALPLEPGARVPRLTARPSVVMPTAWEYTVQPVHLPHVLDQLELKGQHASWIVFMFETALRSDQTQDRVLNLQYSIEKDVVGLDWVLLGERNIADQSNIATFAGARGHRVRQRELNGVPFLRVEDGRLAELGQGIIRDVYALGDEAEIGLLVDGFEL